MSEPGRERFRKVTKLPALPSVVEKLMRMVEVPWSDARDIQRIISSDPGLSAKILRLVNSAYYGFPKRIGSIEHAVVILGFNTVKSLALSASVFEIFSGTGSGMDHEKYRRHSLEVGIMSRILARTGGGMNREEAFMAGILHDIGKIAMDRYNSKEYSSVISSGGGGFERRDYDREIEREHLGFDHTDVGGWLAEEWMLPLTLTEAIRCHHEPDKSENPTAAEIVSLADGLVLLKDPLSMMTGLRGITPETLEMVLEVFEEEIKRTGDFFTDKD